jgi:hypothetical protein
MMAENRKLQAQDETMRKGLVVWVRLTAVIFRVLIILGLITLIIFTILLSFTNIFTIWILAIPIDLILIGIGLARLEYRFHGRLYANEITGPDQIENE